nr:Scr1 family TA system antitoxin-like transcriptional regulator [Streptomyces sp. UNOC14_S4]
MESSPSSAVREARAALGGRLREIRKAGGFRTARAFAARAGWSESKASRIENGITRPSEDDLRQYAELSKVPEVYADLVATVHNIEEMYVEWRRLHRDGLRSVQEARIPLYERTRHFRVYESGVIPGLLQTPAYARSVMSRTSASGASPTTPRRRPPYASADSGYCGTPTGGSASSWRRPRCVPGSGTRRPWPTSWATC